MSERRIATLKSPNSNLQVSRFVMDGLDIEKIILNDGTVIESGAPQPVVTMYGLTLSDTGYEDGTELAVVANKEITSEEFLRIQEEDLYPRILLYDPLTRTQIPYQIQSDGCGDASIVINDVSYRYWKKTPAEP